MEAKKILIIEDEAGIASLLTCCLEEEGFQTRIASSGRQGLEQIVSFQPDLILLDLMLPDISGLDICKKVASESMTPIIMITGRSDTVDKIIGMELGADDYVTKPFDIREVVVRIRALLRRIEHIAETMEAGQQPNIRLGHGIQVLKDRREVIKNGVRVELTNKEFDLLCFLAENKGRVFSRGELLDKVWGFEFVGDTRTVDIHVQRLRKKLDEQKESSIIETVFGVGYKMVEI